VTLPFASPPESLCLLRLSALGDVVQTVPIVRTIQAAWPDTRITWIIGKPGAALLEGLPGVEFIVFDKDRGLNAYGDLARTLKGRRFDILLGMQVALRANAIALMVRAPIKLGFDPARSKDLHRLAINRRIAGRREHVLDGFFSFASALGLDERILRWDIPISDAERGRAEALLPGNQRTLLISPCSSHPLRNWPAASYAKLADHAIDAHGLRVALMGGRSELERRYGDKISAAMQTQPIDLIGRDSLKSSLALLKKGIALVAPDSGPAHMATAVNIPVIGLYAATNSLRSGPYLSLAHCVDRYDQAARRFLNRPAQELKWGTKIERPGVMALIQVDDAIAKLDEIIRQKT
jgi:heptosyltransferase I